jgi:hypothetical protein
MGPEVKERAAFFRCLTCAWNEPIPDGSEPPLWFHEIFRPDGTPYKQEEVDLIKSLTMGE